MTNSSLHLMNTVSVDFVQLNETLTTEQGMRDDQKLTKTSFPAQKQLRVMNKQLLKCKNDLFCVTHILCCWWFKNSARRTEHLCSSLLFCPNRQQMSLQFVLFLIVCRHKQNPVVWTTKNVHAFQRTMSVVIRLWRGEHGFEFVIVSVCQTQLATGGFVLMRCFRTPFSVNALHVKLYGRSARQ